MSAAKIKIKIKHGEFAEVKALVVEGALALHKPHDGGAGFIITHVPTGVRACSVLQRDHADTLFRRMQAFDWTFKATKSAKLKKLEPKMRALMYDVTQSWRINQVVQ